MSQNKSEVNFILVEKKQTTTQFVLAKFLLALHFFFYSQHNKRLAIGYTQRPLYMKFKIDWAKTIGKFYYPFLFIAPCVLTIRLALSYINVLWWWIVIVVIGIWFLYALINLIYDCSCKIRIKTFNASVTADKSIFQVFGNPGSGKTSSVIYKCKILADIMWNRICIEYKMLKPYLEEIKFWPTLKRERAEEIIETYNFYQNSGTYPCLWTAIPCFVDGVPTNILEGAHIAQEERLPYGAVGVIDESRAIIPPELHRTNPDEILFMAKFPRHYGDFHFGLTDQAKEGAFNAWRRCSSENIFMEKQKWVLKPKFLIWLKNTITLRMKKPNKFKVTILRCLEKITSCIGYRKYYYSNFGNEYKQTIEKTKTFILPTFLNADYDDRSCRKNYKCLGKPLKVKKWTSLELTKEQADAIFSSKKIKELMKGKKEKQRENKKCKGEEIYAD